MNVLKKLFCKKLVFCSIIVQSFVFQLDSATSLIQAAKNLMNSVVLAVKANYIASTKYSRAGKVRK